jgi:ABC-2 type transport system permease protein
VSGILLRHGLGAENMAWGFMFLMLPFTCVYYPVSVLPWWLQIVAWVLPPTYVFEGMRALLINHVFRADLMLQSFALNAVIFAIGVAVFMVLLRSARREGTLLQGGD